MTDLRQAAQQALEALTIYSDAQYSLYKRNAITALQAALEQPEQEPVAWMADSGTCVKPDERMNETYYHIPLYTTPPAAQPATEKSSATQPVQEPVGPEPFGYFQYDIRLDAWVQNRINNKGVAFYTKEKP